MLEKGLITFKALTILMLRKGPEFFRATFQDKIMESNGLWEVYKEKTETLARVVFDDVKVTHVSAGKSMMLQFPR